MAKRRGKRGRRKRKRRRDERLDNGSVVYWSRRFVDRRGRRRVPVRCGQCGQVREVSISAPYSERFTGLCRTCAALNMSKTEDETLDDDSVVYWSKRFRDGRYSNGRIIWRVPVRCGICGQVREASAILARSKDFTGLCRLCGHLKTEDELLEDGSIIYWSRRFKDGTYASGKTIWRVPVCCGGCEQVRQVSVSVACGQNFTGLCPACAYLGRTFQIPRSTLEHLYYEEHLSQKESAERLGCSPSVVERRMSEYGIEARPARPYPAALVPEEVLRRWTPELAYVVGLVTTDGNLAKGRNTVSFPSTDRELIEIYQQCLGVSLHVTTGHRPGRLPYHCVWLSDPAYRAFLEEVGLTPAKTKDRTLGTLKIPDEFFRDFFRGVIDGDGSIVVYTRKRWPNRRCLTVGLPSVCRPFLIWIRDTIARLTGVEGAIYRASRAFCLQFTDSKARQLLFWLYYAPDLPCLQRKRDVWEAYVRSMPQPTEIVTPGSKHSRRWHIADETKRTLCGKDAARWRPVPSIPENCLHDDRRVCRICREALAHLLELDRYRQRYDGSAGVG